MNETDEGLTFDCETIWEEVPVALADLQHARDRLRDRAREVFGAD